MTETVVHGVYFDRPGPENTERTLQIAGVRAGELKIRTILVATTSGATGLAAVQALPGHRVVAVTHSEGFHGPNTQEVTQEHCNAIRAAGGVVLTCQHAFGGVGRAVRRKLQTYELEEIIAYTFRTFGEGTKVAMEIALMAADAGLVRVGEPAISIGGTGRGVDTALVLLPANAQSFFDLRVLEVLCKPRLARAEA
jgi:uncharacterized protein